MESGAGGAAAEIVITEEAARACLPRVPPPLRRATLVANWRVLAEARGRVMAGGHGVPYEEVARILGISSQFWDDVFRLPGHEWVRFDDQLWLREPPNRWA